MMSISLREPYLFDLPIGANASGYLLPAYLSQLGRTSRRRLVFVGAPVRNQHLRRHRGPRRRGRLLRLSIAGSRRLPGRERFHVVGLDQAESPVGQPQQPIHAHQGTVRATLHRARLGQLHLDQVRRRGTDVSYRPSVARTAPASSSSRCGAISGSRPNRPRSTSDTSPVTSPACAGFNIERSVPTHSMSRPAVS